MGSFRVGEILALKSDKHIRNGTFTGRNIQKGSAIINGSKRNFVKVKLDNPKEDKARLGAEVELFELDGIFFDPVRALNNWLAKSALQIDADLPVYRWENGSNFTPAEFNLILKDLLRDNIKYEDGKVSSHCFRAGVASTMAKLGYSEDMIQLQGRWASQAYLRYCKLGRANKLEDQFNLFTLIAREACNANIM